LCRKDFTTIIFFIPYQETALFSRDYFLFLGTVLDGLAQWLIGFSGSCKDSFFATKTQIYEGTTKGKGLILSVLNQVNNGINSDGSAS